MTKYMERQSMKTFVISCLCLLAMTVPTWAVNIAWLSLHDTDEAIAGSQTHGFTAAAGQEYVDVLRDAGHTVTRFLTQAPTAAFIDNLDDFDLVISSRQVNSGDYQDEPERALWHGMTTPMMMMSAYILRNNRLQFFTADAVPDHNAQTTVILTADQPSHPIFEGIALDASNSIEFADYPVLTPNGTEQRGISVSTDAPAGSGTVLASVGTAGDGTAGGTLIAHFPTGSQHGNYTLAADRMVFLSGSREHDGGGVPIAGLFDLTPVGTQLFLNSVCFMAGGCGAPLVPGDTDGNGTVEFADFEPIRVNFRKMVTARNQGDLVTNGVVDFADFRQWKDAFVGAGGSLAGLDLSFGANVPEPAAWGLALMGLCGLAGAATRRRVDK
jgi:hypothetical protein